MIAASDMPTEIGLKVATRRKGSTCSAMFSNINTIIILRAMFERRSIKKPSSTGVPNMARSTNSDAESVTVADSFEVGVSPVGINNAMQERMPTRMISDAKMLIRIDSLRHFLACFCEIASCLSNCSFGDRTGGCTGGTGVGVGAFCWFSSGLIIR